MPGILSPVITSETTTETSEITATHERLIRYRNPVAIARTVTSKINQVGGVWGLECDGAQSNSESKGLARRVRKRSFSSASSTQSRCDRTTVLPSLPVPIGKCFYQGLPLSGQSFVKGSTIPIVIDVQGKRLELLEVQLELVSLSGAVKLSKRLGMGSFRLKLTDENGDGTEDYSGEIFISPSDCLFPGTLNPLEMTYSLSIGNQTTRKYQLERGRINFVD